MRPERNLRPLDARPEDQTTLRELIDLGELHSGERFEHLLGGRSPGTKCGKNLIAIAAADDVGRPHGQNNLRAGGDVVQAQRRTVCRRRRFTRSQSQRRIEQ